MDQIKNITKNIINILCVILFIILALVIYAKLKVSFSNDVHANYFGVRIFEVASGSMEPTLKINDVLLVKVNVDELQKDDIIAYKSEDTIITHRIVMINDNDLIVKGDANNTVDSPIKKEQVIGKVIKVFPHLGVWKKILTEPKILVLIFITLLLFDGALSYNGKDKKNNKEEIKKEEVKEIKQETKKEDIKVDVVQEDNKTKNNNDLLTKSKMLAKQNIDDLLKQAEDKIQKEEQQQEEGTEYTIRLDLNEIQKNINKSVK